MRYIILKFCFGMLVQLSSLQASNSQANCGYLQHVYDLTTCIKTRWRIHRHRTCPEYDTYEVHVDDCNGTLHTFQIHNNNEDFIDLGFSSIYCKSSCLIRFQDSNSCILLNISSGYRNYQLISHCMGVEGCVPVANNQGCEENHVQYSLNSTVPDEFDVCLHPRSQDNNCAMNIDNCITDHHESNENVLVLIKECHYSMNDLKMLPTHTQCTSKQTWLTDNGCTELFIPLSQTLINFSSLNGYCETIENVCPALIPPTQTLMPLETTLVHEVPYTLTEDLITEGIVVTGLQNHQTATVAMADLTITIFSSFLAMLVAHRLVRHELLVIVTILIVLSETSQALEFGESDIFIREEQAVRPVAIQRRDTKYPLGLKVYSRTVDEYKQIQEQTGCNLTLEDIGIQESQIDPAEGADISRSEYEIIFDADVREVSINLEVFDDQLSEKDEYFILYLNYSELSSDRCALAVRIMDNDWLMFKFSTSQVMINEDFGEYFNLSIIKIGHNEPNVTIEIGVTEPRLDVSLQGVDFDLLKTRYMFDNGTSEQTVHIIVYDDKILEAEEYFWLYFPSLTTNNDVHLIAETIPNRATVTIQDNEVAVVGFTTVGDVILEEGGSSAPICAGFDSDMDGMTIDTGAYLVITIVDLLLTPGTGHDLILEPSATLYVDASANIDCLDVSSAYDTNLNESVHNLSLQIRDTSSVIRNVFFSQQYLNVYVTPDYHGLVFISEPSNITIGIGMDVYFSCDYVGTHATPVWNITNSIKRTSRLVSTARLPHKHYSTGKGLGIIEVDETHNLTRYACMFRVYDRDELVIISSKEGTLTVLDTITFAFQLSGFELSVSNRTIELFQGDSIPSMTIRKFGYSSDTFIIIVRIKSFNNDHCSKPFKDQTLWYAFDTQTYEHTLPDTMLGDEPQHPIAGNYLVEIISPVSSIEKSGAHVVIPDPILIRIFDKDISVGFTEENISLQEGFSRQICLTTFHKIHQHIKLNFTLQLQDSIAGCVVFENSITLSAINTTGCTTVLVGDYKRCNGNMNITVMAIYEGTGENNVTFFQPFITITLTTVDESGVSLSVVFAAIFAPIVAILLILIAVMILIKFCCICCQSKKDGINISVDPNNIGNIVDSGTMRSDTSTKSKRSSSV